MNKKILIVIVGILVIGFMSGYFYLMIKNNEKLNNLQNQLQENNEDTKNKEKINMNEIIIKVNGKILNVKLEDNTSSKAFFEKLKSGDITISAHDYGNFEKVGNLGFNLPTNDENITTEAGDLILYQGNQITLYYDTNNWLFTKLGKVQNISQDELKNILGRGNVELTFSLND